MSGIVGPPTKAQRAHALGLVRRMPPGEAREHARAWVRNWRRTAGEISSFIERMTGASA